MKVELFGNDEGADAIALIPETAFEVKWLESRDNWKVTMRYSGSGKIFEESYDACLIIE